MNYTKGEWKKEGNKIKAFGQGTIAICPSPTNNEGVFEFVANAHLIAAAPEMLESGKDLLRVMCELCRRLNPQHESCQSCEEIKGYRKAFNKAEGK